jgi:hypothetical protein
VIGYAALSADRLRDVVDEFAAVGG